MLLYLPPGSTALGTSSAPLHITGHGTQTSIVTSVLSVFQRGRNLVKYCSRGARCGEPIPPGARRRLVRGGDTRPAASRGGRRLTDLAAVSICRDALLGLVRDERVSERRVAPGHDWTRRACAGYTAGGSARRPTPLPDGGDSTRLMRVPRLCLTDVGVMR